MAILATRDYWISGSKLAEEIHKPVLVLSNDKETQLSRGSARSQNSFDLIAALRGFADRLERYGGHTQAAGLLFVVNE